MLSRLCSWLGSVRASLVRMRARLLVLLLPAVSGGSSTAPPRWDAKAGVWVGERAAGSSLEIPEPLWIFGYGSLCWRPDFPHEETMVVAASL